MSYVHVVYVKIKYVNFHFFLGSNVGINHTNYFLLTFPIHDRNEFNEFNNQEQNIVFREP